MSGGGAARGRISRQRHARASACNAWLSARALALAPHPKPMIMNCWMSAPPDLPSGLQITSMAALPLVCGARRGGGWRREGASRVSREDGEPGGRASVATRACRPPQQRRPSWANSSRLPALLRTAISSPPPHLGLVVQRDVRHLLARVEERVLGGPGVGGRRGGEGRREHVAADQSACRARRRRRSALHVEPACLGCAPQPAGLWVLFKELTWRRCSARRPPARRRTAASCPGPPATARWGRRTG